MTRRARKPVVESRPEGAAADVARTRSEPGGARRPRPGATAPHAIAGGSVADVARAREQGAPGAAAGGTATAAGAGGITPGNRAAAPAGADAGADGGIAHAGDAGDLASGNRGATAAETAAAPGRPASPRRAEGVPRTPAGGREGADGENRAGTRKAAGAGGARTRAGAAGIDGKRRDGGDAASPAAGAGEVARAKDLGAVARRARTAAEAVLAAGDAAYGDGEPARDGGARSAAAAAIRRKREAGRETAGAADDRAEAASGGNVAARAPYPPDGAPASTVARAKQRTAAGVAPEGAATAPGAVRVPGPLVAGPRIPRIESAAPRPGAPGRPERPARPGGPALKRRGAPRRAGRKAGAADPAAAAKARMQSRRAWLAARAEAAGASARSAAAAAKGKAAAAASSAAAPLAGVLAGVVCFTLAVMAASQAVSALLGFWEGEAAAQAVEGLPPYVTYGMVEAAVGCQEEYGHPAGCTLAQLIVESGVGDSLSGLAERDANLFGIKWSPSFFGCPEVAGKSSWGTQEEAGGELVGVMADFAVFRSPEDCIRFRSRVVLASERYAGNALIQEAVAGRDSDKMAEGLADAGWATSSSYADALKSAMDLYGLRRFDGLSLADFHAGGAAADGNAVVEAARTQLGVPYVWGGTAPGVGLDCSGLTQWCYAQAGIAIPRNSEDQAAAGAHVPLSQARPGDVLWRPGHVAVYIGGDEYIHEPQAGDVCRVASGISYFTCAVRF